MKVASAQFLLKSIKRWKSFETQVKKIVHDAISQKAQMIVFPEYLGGQLSELAKPEEDPDEIILSYYHNFQELFTTLSKKHSILILAGTTLFKEENGYYNRALLFYPNGKINWQDKVYLTPSEKLTQMKPSKNYTPTFDTDFGKIGIAICYDSEFPHLIKQSVKEGANVILVPSCTPTLAGYYRVSISCRARAIENQCFVVQSCILGGASLRDWDSTHFGQSAIYSPSDKGFPPSGILSQTKMNKIGLAIAEIDFQKLEFIRKEGEVLNYRDHTLQNIYSFQFKSTPKGLIESSRD